ncbi:IS200/IS605 family transposase [Streptomyces sp. NBC_00564]|uniref:IS200/IS605 family transposase n=1 Tax=Streptomyces sp. NBC_00564 TaxID=2903663 RepID=UPI00352C52D4
MLTRCEAITRDMRQSFEAELREVNCEGDHVYLLVHFPPKVQLSKLVNCLKGLGSQYLRAERTGRINRIDTGSVFWSPSYFAGPCGCAPKGIIKQYIDRQQRPLWPTRLSSHGTAFPPGLKAGRECEDQGCPFRTVSPALGRKSGRGVFVLAVSARRASYASDVQTLFTSVYRSMAPLPISRPHPLDP